MKAAGITGAISILFALGLLVASESTTFEAQSHRGKVRANVRFLKEEDKTDAYETQEEADLTYRGPDMVRGQDESEKYGNEIFDFVGYKQRVVCAEYRGVDHPNARGCCAEACGREYCGTAECHSGPGGAEACCEHAIQLKFCSPTQMAPCMLNTTHMAHHFKDRRCLEHDGVDNVEKTACCPATCGEFCGAKFCHDFNPPGSDGLESSECCPQDYMNQCAPGVMAPCLLSKQKTPKTPKTGKLSYETHGFVTNSKIAGDETMTMRPIFSGSAKAPVSYHLSKKAPALPSWCNFSTSSGVLTCHLEDSGYENVPTDQLWYSVEASNGEHIFVGEVFVPFANPPVKLSYKLPDSFKDYKEKELLPQVECVWPPAIAATKKGGECDPDYTIAGTIHALKATGITFDKKTGAFYGDLSKFPQAKEERFAVTARSEKWGSKRVSFEFVVPALPTLQSTTTTPRPSTAIPVVAPLISYRTPDKFTSNQKLKLLPEIKGGEPTKYVVHPSLPKGLSLDESTGEIKGTLGVIGKRTKTFTITASNKAGNDSHHIVLPMPLRPPIDLVLGGLPKDFATHKELKLVPTWTGGDPTHYKIEPEVPYGWKFSSSTGVLQGRVSNMSDANLVKYTLIAENAAGNASYDFDLPMPTGIHYTQPNTFDKAISIPPTVSGPKPTIYTVAPALPVGMFLDRKTGIVFGNIVQPTNKLYDYKITGKTSVGNITSIIKLPHAGAAPFPWWIIVLILLLIAIGLLVYFLTRKKKEELTYSPLVVYEPVDPAPPPRPVKLDPPPPRNNAVQSTPPPPPIAKPSGFPLVFDIGNGEEVTKWATRKPLGLEYAKRLPIKISQETDGHGQELGIQVGWTLLKVNNRDVSPNGCQTFQDARLIMQEEISKLPGGIPLTFIRDSNNAKNAKETTVWATKTPLGLEYKKRLPLTIDQVVANQHGEELGIRTGWILKAVNYRDCFNCKEYAEVKAILQEEMGGLKGRVSISSQRSGL